MIEFKNSKFLYFASLMLLCYIAFTVYCGLSIQDLKYNYLNSDTLYLPSLYKDLFLDQNSLKGWNLNPAPNFFPDMFIYIILNAITGNFVLSTFLYSIVQLSLFSLLFLLILKEFSKQAYTYMIYGNALLSLFLWVHIIESDTNFTFQLLSNSYHLGACVNMLFCFLYVLKYLTKEKIYWLILFIVHGIIATVSDRLFIVALSVPVTCAILVALFSKKQLKNLIVLFAANALTVFLGLQLFEELRTSNYIKIQAPHTFMSFENIQNSFAIVKSQLTIYFINYSVRTLILLVTFGALLMLTVFLIKSRKRFFHKAHNYLELDVFSILFFGIALVGLLMAPIIGGSYTGSDTIRYNYFSYLGLVILFPFLLHQTLPLQFNRKAMIWIGPLFLFSSALFFSFKNPPGNFKNFLNYYPKKVEILDSLSKKHNFKYGVATYWDAKKITLFSKTGLRAYAVFDIMTPWYHSSNEVWYHKPNPKSWFYNEHNKSLEEVDFDYAIVYNESQLNSVHEHIGQEIKILDLMDNEKVYILPTYRYSPDTFLPYPVK